MTCATSAGAANRPIGLARRMRSVSSVTPGVASRSVSVKVGARQLTRTLYLMQSRDRYLVREMRPPLAAAYPGPMAPPLTPAIEQHSSK